MANPGSTSSIASSMDIAARTIDLLAVLARMSDTTGATAILAKEIGRWLGKEGLDENELEFFLHKSRSLVMPNHEEKVTAFFQSVTGARLQKLPIVPLWAQPSGALGRLISGDPLQKWITSTICCLFRYHDESYIKAFLPTFIIVASQQDQAPPPKHRLERQPEKLRLDAVARKVIESCWLHITNASLLGEPQECPHLPEVFSWACKDGHNIESYKLAVLMSKLSSAHTEIIIQSENLLTNLVLWVLWHYAGRFRVVVSGRVIYDNELGHDGTVLECRVAKFCSKERSKCTHELEGVDMAFQVLENVAGNLHSIFTGHYDTSETMRHENWTRQELYSTPFRHPKAQKSVESLTRRTAQELLKWYINLPVATETIYVGSKLSFRLDLSDADQKSSEGFKVGDILGRTPRLLNMKCGELGRPFVVFSRPTDERAHQPEADDFNSENLPDLDGEDDLKGRLNELLEFFPILYDLSDELKATCTCFHCDHKHGRASQTLHKDENCLAYSAIMEVMFYFSHGIADAFGAQDASGTGKPSSEDFGATQILRDALYWNVLDSNEMAGTMSWHTLLSTAARVFLGCQPLHDLTDACRDNGGIDVHTSLASHVKPTTVAIQYGALAVVAPWLDISRQLNRRRCFRFEMVQGCVALLNGEYDGRYTLHSVPGDIGVIETQRTEDLSDLAEYSTSSLMKPAARLQVIKDPSQQLYDWVLVSVDRTRLKLLMRVLSGQHSRMVEPSRAIIQLSRAISVPTCRHTTSYGGIVPENSVVDLKSFEELLGGWDYSESDDVSELDSESDASPAPKKRKTDTSGKMQLIHITQILDTSFKFNTALALAGDDPVLVNYGGTCLACALEYARDIPAENGRDDYCRWLIHRARDPAGTIPQIKAPRRLALLGSRGSQVPTER